MKGRNGGSPSRQAAPPEKGRIRRRGLLKGIAAGSIAPLGLATGAASGAETVRRVVGTASAEATQAAKGAADRVIYEFDFGDIGGAVVGLISDRDANRLGRRSDVRYVELDGWMHLIGHNPGHEAACADGSTQTLPWGVDRVDAEVAHDPGHTGAGAHIAVIDTGIDVDHPDLPELGTSEAILECQGPDCGAPWDEDNGHGTHVAGIANALDNEEGVVGVSTEAVLHAVKVFRRGGSTRTSNVVAGINWVREILEPEVSPAPVVINMSLGGGDEEQLRDACNAANDADILLAAAAGNSLPAQSCSVSFPAAYDSVIAVSATNQDDELASFSCTGPEVELAAPGRDICSTVPDGEYDTNSGTSMACPHVAGAAAQVMAELGLDNTGAREQLRDTAEDLGLSTEQQGSGLVDVAAALGLDSSDDP